MLGKRGNSLIVIENGILTSYVLDDKVLWEVGRPSAEKIPDIMLHTSTVSRRHGRFQNMDGMWFYIDNNGKNGTVYNEKHIDPGIKGRTKPVALANRDVLIFGGGEKPIINSKTVWAMFLDRVFVQNWCAQDSKGMQNIMVSIGGNRTIVEKPQKGTVIEGDEGIAIYMGEVTYLMGDAEISDK